MSSQTQAAYSVVSATGYVGTNVLAWISSFDAGAFATGITIISLAGIAAYTNWAKSRSKLEADRIREIEKAKAEAWAERVRLEMQVQADREKIEANSLNGQIKSLKALLEEGNSRTADMQKRVEDANQKLHDAANERQLEVIRHREEVQMLMKQLAMVTHELEESREENRALMTELEQKVQANTGAIDRIVSPDTGTAS